jgi:hypothetical protein
LFTVAARFASYLLPGWANNLSLPILLWADEDWSRQEAPVPALMCHKVDPHIESDVAEDVRERVRHCARRRGPPAERTMDSHVVEGILTASMRLARPAGKI